MRKKISFSLEDKDDEGKKTIINFIVEKLPAIEQSFLIMKIIGIVARGANERMDLQVEQILHNLFQTGHTVEGAGNIKIEKSTVGSVVLNAIKGAIGNLSDGDRDELISILLKDVKIVESEVYSSKVTLAELNNRISSFQTFFKLLFELVKINLGFFSPKTG